MKTLDPRPLEQSPQKPINYVPKKVEVGKAPPIDDSVNWLDAIRLWVGKKIENVAFAQFSESIGKPVVIAGSAIGGGMFASINWGLLLTGNVFEIIKLVIAIVGLLVGWFWKK